MSSSSITNTTPFSFTRSPTSTFLPPPSNGGPGKGSSLASAALYLYTFLATLLLLLAISSAIVIRSVVLRRRRRRIIQEAIRNGVWPPPELAHLATLGVGTEFGLGNPALARTKDIGKKPRMWEVYLHPPGEKVINAAGTYWDGILPLHAALVEHDKKDGNSNESPVQDSPTQAEEDEQGSTWWGRARRRRRQRRRTVQAPFSAFVWRIAAPHPFLPPSHGPESSGGAAEISSSPLSSNAVNAEAGIQGTLLEMDVSKPTPLTVAMLIAMPRPPTRTTQISNLNFSNADQTQTGQGGEEEEEVFLPHLELGVAEVVVLPLSESDHVDEERDGDMPEGRERERT